MNTSKVSVVIPVFNSESHLPKALDSLVRQTLESIEVVVVNDGSQGNCDEVVARYEKLLDIQYVRLSTNMGRMIARTEGMKVASGEYVGFVDADDFAEPDMYRSLYRAATRHNADIVHCHTNYLTRDEAIEWTVGAPRHRKLVDKLIFDKFLDHQLAWSLWDKLFSRDLIAASLLEIPCYRVQLNEDTIICCVLFYYAKKYVSIDKRCYNYVVHEDSVTSTRGHKNIEDSLFMVSFVLDFCRKHRIDHESRNLIWGICQWPFALMHDIPESEIAQNAKVLERYFQRIEYTHVLRGLTMYLRSLESKNPKP